MSRKPTFAEGERVHHSTEKWDGTVLPSLPQTSIDSFRIKSDGGYTGEYARKDFVLLAPLLGEET